MINFFLVALETVIRFGRLHTPAQLVDHFAWLVLSNVNVNFDFIVYTMETAANERFTAAICARGKNPNLINMVEAGKCSARDEKAYTIPFNKLQCACVRNISHFDLFLSATEIKMKNQTK